MRAGPCAATSHANQVRGMLGACPQLEVTTAKLSDRGGAVRSLAVTAIGSYETSAIGSGAAWRYHVTQIGSPRLFDVKSNMTYAVD